MELIRFGDHIAKGEYIVHSSFNDVVNLVKGNELLTLASPQKNSGPFNIIINNLNTCKINSVNIYDDYFKINNYILKIESNKKWSSAYIVPEIKISEIKFKLDLISDTLRQILPSNSLLFIFDTTPRINIKGFNKAMNESIKQGITELFSNNPINGIKLLKGKGIGLTPSGDDFITGYLYAFYIWDSITGSNNKNHRQEVYSNALTNNLISVSQLKAASNGWFSESLIPFLDWILKNNNISLKQSLTPALSCGATSGADMLAGFILTFNHLIDKFLHN